MGEFRDNCWDSIVDKGYNIMYTVYILEVFLEDIGILKMESIFLHTNITIIPHSVLYVSLLHYQSLHFSFL